ncbi:hypothetical protein [Streptococcus suis]|uniref:hypothetical protein n=1 Tax=Streptococcus suis TaxID=1307 RepID=UPI001C95E887|nr:hypothetical protein [Streptococcus suis]MBY5009398.1 hypothetical protein [Streptococcus suis]MDG4518781.1 hypothetical protein [Streptococcus suis]
MGIDNHLKVIKEAVFGRDVRQAIHDGIQQAYDDATANGNANMEVAKARGYANTLVERLDQMEQADKTTAQDISVVSGQIDNLIANAGNGTVPSELTDMRVAYNGESFNTAGKAVREQFTKLSNGILTGDMVFPLVKSEAITDFINPRGWNKISELVSGGSTRYLTVRDALKGGTKVSVKVDRSQAAGLNPRFTIVQFNNSTGDKIGDLVSGVTSSGSFDLPEGYLYTILFATNADLTQSNVATYFSVELIHYAVDYAAKSITLDKISDETIKALSAQSVATLATKSMHMSFDDTWQCLYDLVRNKNNYLSIFDNPFLNDLKEVHGATGMVFTLNCFNAYSGRASYNISDLAGLTKFSKEFQENSSWLRFSFHAQDDSSRYDSDQTSQIVQSYNTFTNAIYQMTGTTDSIDTVVRLGFFTGSLSNCLALRDAACGITGILAADDTRSDYYFDSTTRNYLALRGFEYDSTNRLKLCKSFKRLESITDISVELANYDGLVGANKNKRLEFFTHEYAWNTQIKSMLLQIGTWANGRGYSHLYLQDV